MTLRVTLTGALTLSTEGYHADESALGGQTRLLCGYLVTERHRSIERDELAEILWPAELPSSWEASLRALLSRVRRFFGSAGLPTEHVLTHAFGCYQLNLPPDSVVDTEEMARDVEGAETALRSGEAVDAARRARSAAAVAERPFLPGVDAPWVERKREELRSWRVRALEALAEAQLDAGEASPAADSASEAMEISPFRETVHRLLMRAHAALGNRAEALRVYESCRRLLSDELGVDPSPETEALYLRLLREDTPGATRAPSPARSGPLPATRSGFVGRDSERAAIARAWNEARDGRLSCVLLEGDPGMGKSRLAAETARAVAGDGGLVLTGRSAEEIGIPYLPFVEALKAFLAQAPPEGLGPSLGHLAPELVRLVPTLRHRLPELAEPTAGEPETERYRLFEAVASWLATASSEIPILLVLDDLHWADAPTISLLRHLLRSIEPMHVLILGAYRGVDTHAGHPLAAMLAGEGARGGVDRLTLPGLSREEVEALLATEGLEGAGVVAGWVHTQTGGNPFFATELLRHLLDDGAVARGDEGWSARSLEESGVPGEIRELISRRTSRLPAPCSEVLALASVLGAEFDVGLLVTLSDHPEDAVLDALDDARRAGLLTDATSGRDRAAFVHALVRAALYDEISEPRKMRLHLRAARALEPRADSEERLAELAHHFARAAPLGEGDRAVRYAILAGDRARAALAFEQAAAHYERALAVLDQAGEPVTERQCDIEIALGETLHRSGAPRHRDVLVLAAEHARALEDPERLGRVGLALNKMGSPSSSGAEDLVTAQILDEALGGMSTDDSELRARVMATLAAELMWGPDMQRRRELGDGAKDMARRLGPHVLAEVVYPAHFATSSPDNLSQRISEADELIGIAQRIGDREQVCRGHMMRVDALVEAGDIEAADGAMATADRLIEELRQPFMTWEVVMRRAGRELLAGRLGDVEKYVQSAYELGVELAVPQSLMTAVYGSQLLMLRFEQGRLDELVPLASSVAELSPTWGSTIRAFLLAETGREDEARPALVEATAAALAAAHDIQWLAAMVMRAQICASVNDVASAEAMYPALAAYPGRMAWVTSVTSGPTDLGLGLLAATMGDLEAASGHYAAAAALCERMGAEGWLARTRCEWAYALGEGDQALELASAAESSADERGQVKVATRARRMLEATSAPGP